MKRIPLPDESEHGWQVDPSSIEQVIESRLRRQEHEEHLDQINKGEVRAKPLRPAKPRFGLTEMEMELLQQEAEARFLDSARLPEELRDRRQVLRENFEKRVKFFQKEGDAAIKDEARLQAVLFAPECASAIAKATGHYAERLCMAVIARRGRTDFPLELRTKLWAASLEFAMGLAEFGIAGLWVDRAWGCAPRESPVPRYRRLDSISEEQNEAKKFMQLFQPDFSERLRHGSYQWLEQADRQIELCCILRSGVARPKLDGSKKAVWVLLFTSPDLTAEQVCAKLDGRNERNPGQAPIPAPIPAGWKKRGARSWIDSYERFPSTVKTFISRVRQQAG